MALANGGVLDGWCSPNGLFGVMNSASQEAVLFTGLVGASSDDWWSSNSSVMSMSFAASEGAPCTSSLSLDVEECDVWIDAVEQNYYQLNNHFGSRSGTAVADWLIEDQICAAEIVSAHSSSPVKRSCISGQQKRPRSDNNLPSPKKRCGATRTTTKEMQSPSKDSQTIAAKNRREKISERLKILQELVPSGTKVDLVTMLEKAIDYVKFLQLQVKVLATDEFWPAQGGQAPGVAQVEQVIDAILSSQTQA